MKINIKKKWSIITISTLLILTTCCFFLYFFLYIEYRHNNPPITITEYGNKSENTPINGLVSHWEFDEINNGMIKDVSGNKNSGTIKSAINLHYFRRIFKNTFDRYSLFAIPKIVKGKRGNAIDLNGRQWVSGGNIKDYNTNTFTISTWIWRDDDDDIVPTFMAKSTWPFDGWWLCTKPSSRYIVMGIAWGESHIHIDSGYQLPLKEWHHIAVTMNNQDHIIQFFIDGLPYGEKHENIHEWLINWNHDLFIGDYDGSGRWPWSGRIDDTRYYDKILSSKEIFEIYKFEI